MIVTIVTAASVIRTAVSGRTLICLTCLQSRQGPKGEKGGIGELSSPGQGQGLVGACPFRSFIHSPPTNANRSVETGNALAEGGGGEVGAALGDRVIGGDRLRKV